ncbi:MAG TPA: TIGR03118 family protein [Terriglobales bacterium]|nr:TIGR03118 family protein [Terriglobales bacterium]
MTKRTLLLVLGMALALGFAPAAPAQQTSYTQTNLTANVAGVAAHTDAQLSNPWGISFIPGDVFWIANNNGGTSTTYDAQGVKQAITAGIPVASMNPCNPGCPTGTVANQSTDFGGATFLFDTEDGIVASWNGTANAITKVDNSPGGAVYKGLALVSNAQGNFLLAANFHSGKIDVYDHNFQPATLSGGTFTDPNLPAGYAPHGVHVINNVVFVTYAVQDAAKHDPLVGAGMGLVDLFQTDGHFERRGMTGGTLNAPWGIASAPANFGAFSNDVLVGNFGDGTISAYDSTGSFLGQLKNSNAQVITNPGLWELVFGAGGTGDPNTLYFTAGGAAQTSGLFGTLVPAAAAGTDFNLNLSAPAATVTRGGSTSLNIDASGSGGFNSPISLSCSGLPTGVTCTFVPATITPGGTAASSQLTIAVGTGYVPPTGYVVMGSLTGMGLLGLVYGARKRDQGGMARRTGIWALGSVVLLLGLLLAAVGCGSSSSNHVTPPGAQSVMVVGTGGGISHSFPLSLTIH